jgi:hypothetical protein
MAPIARQVVADLLKVNRAIDNRNSAELLGLLKDVKEEKRDCKDVRPHRSFGKKPSVTIPVCNCPRAYIALFPRTRVIGEPCRKEPLRAPSERFASFPATPERVHIPERFGIMLLVFMQSIKITDCLITRTP